jgi:acetyl esterase/lipase
VTAIDFSTRVRRPHRAGIRTFLCASALLAIAASVTSAAADLLPPSTQVFAWRDSKELRTTVYRSSDWRQRDKRAAIIMFSGRGWNTGQADCDAAQAQHFAAKGMVSVCAMYRAAIPGKSTPLDSMADARDAIRWVRANAAALGVDPNRIAVQGSSTAGHLAVAAAMFELRGTVSPMPNALVLYSPAVDVENNQALQQLLGTKETAANISPILHVTKGLPPTIILQGDVDTVTPIAGAQKFCAKMKQAGNRCELDTYMYMGHLFTPKGKRDDQVPQPDPRVAAAALAKVDAFLASLGYIAK